MRKLQFRTLTVPAFLFAVCATFQNCDSGFHYDPTSKELSSLGSTDITSVFGVQAYTAGSTSPLDPSTSMTSGSGYEVRATGDNVSSALLTWSVNPSSTASCALSSIGILTKRALKCTSAGSLRVDLQAVWSDSTITSVSMNRTVGAVVATPTPSQNSADIVTFRIVSGTGGSPWNTSVQPVEVFVGQTLTVYNDDSKIHRLHTSGSPFNHQVDSIVVNGSSSFVILNSHAATATDVYDHDSALSAIFYIEAIDGTAAYSKNSGSGSCAGCHGSSVASSAKRGSSYTSIKNAIAANRGGMGSITLSDQEIKAIAYVLNK